MTFEQYLQDKRYSPRTIHYYGLYAGLFTDWLTQEQLTGEQASYNDVIAFMRYLNDQGKSKKRVHSQLNVIRHYFTYLIAEGLREDNPAAGIFVQGIVRKLPNNLLSMEELEELHRRYQLQLNVGPVKKIMLGLLIYQGLQSEEINRLEAAHVHLKEGKIFVRGTPWSNERWLPLQAHQAVELQQYLATHRGREGQLFLPTDRINASPKSLHNRMQHMIVQLQKLSPKIINANQIRNSVITFWLQRYHLRQVQYM